MAAESAVGFLLENVKELGLYYLDLLNKAKAKDDQEELEYKLRLLKGILKEASNNPRKSELFKEMEKQIRKVVYEIEDIIDSCFCHAIEEKAKSTLRKQFSTNKIDLAEKVKQARLKANQMLVQVQTDLSNMPFADPVQTAQTQTQKSQAPSLRHDNIVVLEDQEKQVHTFLEDTKNDKLDVYSIVGMAGLGKSTLAWKIFQSEKIKFEFPIRMWIYVSQEFNCREVLIKILKEFSPETNYNSTVTDDELKMAVRGCLKECKFLLVLDDVWTADAWREIENVLPKNNSKGKIVITTRSNGAGSAACAPRPHHELRFLEDTESWDLLQYEVFGKLDAYPKQLKEIGFSIAAECKGLPLAIVVTGGILKEHYNTKPIPETIVEWKNVSQNVSMHLQINDRTDRLVGLSYGILSDELRHCLLYLGVFPKGFGIPVSTLTRLWMAEGFIQQKEGQSLEKSAHDNLNDLINRNLVMVAERNLFGEVKKCRVHDVIREFCKSKAAIDEQNLFEEIKLSDGVFSPPVEQIHKHRRLCIHSHLHDLLSKKLPGTSVARSFLCFNKEPFLLHPKYNSSIPNNFKLLRVLDSNSFKFPIFPLKITQLIHLRYLTLSCDDLDVLPEVISSKLWNLQTVILNTNKREIQVKANIWKMTRLRHLKTKAAILLDMEHRGVAGENLQTLSRLSPGNCKQDVFDKARNLKRLGIRGPIANLLDVQFSPGTLSHLENLKLQNDLPNEAACDKPLAALPKFLPATLKRLTLSKTYLTWAHMPALAGIHTLEMLKLKDYAFTGDSWKLGGYSFPALQFLLIADTDLQFWEASTEEFPCIWYLSLKNCRKLSQIPMCFANSTLQNLDIERVHSAAVVCAKNIKKEKEAITDSEGARWGRFQLTIAPARD